MRIVFGLLIAASLWAQDSALPDGLYARITTNKGVMVARLEPDLTPLTVANFVGLAEGSIVNAAFDPGRPFFDGTVYHRVVPGHVIQTGVPQSDRAKGPGYQFPNEIHARLSHNHLGALNMANAGPNTNSSQFCVMLGDRSYLDGNYTVFGEVVQGLDVVRSIVQGDVVETVRIERVGEKAQAYRVTDVSFRAMKAEAEKRVAEHLDKKRAAEADWLAQNRIRIAGESAPGGGGAMRVRYRGRELHYSGDVIGRTGPAIEVRAFVSKPDGTPGLGEPAEYPVGTKVNPGLDAVVASMKPAERRTVAIPADRAYGRAGFYAPEVSGQRRLVISPNALLVYELEAGEVK